MSLMLQEIHQQPEALAKTLSEESTHIREFSRFVAARSIDLIVLVARGSSDNAALFGKYLLEITTGIPVSHGVRAQKLLRKDEALFAQVRHLLVDNVRPYWRLVIVVII